MKINDEGLKLIEEFEGCRLTAYKPVAAEKYWTIGYGHYGKDVYQGMRITQAQAEMYLKQDVARFETAVNNLKREWTENQFSALVSFTYNCGEANLKTLCRNRTPAEIASKLLLYTKGADGKVLNGLVRRRKAERDLFLKPSSGSSAGSVAGATASEVKTVKQYAGVVTASSGLNVRTGAGTGYSIFKVGSTELKLPKGMVISIEAESSGFGKLTGVDGWVSLNYVKKN